MNSIKQFVVIMTSFRLSNNKNIGGFQNGDNIMQDHNGV